MNISKFANHLPEKPFHSSGYARVARGDKIGSTNTQTFHERLQLERRRKAVNRYHDSMVANNHSRLLSRLNRSDEPARSVQNSESLSDRRSAASARQAPSRQMDNPAQQQAPPARKFVEPPSRKYNPYG